MKSRKTMQIFRKKSKVDCKKTTVNDNSTYEQMTLMLIKI